MQNEKGNRPTRGICYITAIYTYKTVTYALYMRQYIKS